MSDNRNQSRSRGRGQQTDTRQPSYLGKIVLTKDQLSPGIFSDVAEDAAKHIAGITDTSPRTSHKASRPTQLRKFYDELCMWDNKIQLNPADFEKQLPFILMLKAKVAYAKGRLHVGREYQDLINRCLEQVQENPVPDTLHNCKLFLEAFTGYYKVYGPKS